MTFTARQDDLASVEVQSLISEHLQGMHSNTPPEHVHALGIAALKNPAITFWSIWEGPELCGCVALKALSPDAGEIKSMRTRATWLRRGVGQFAMDVVAAAAMHRAYRALYLETGPGPAFAAAHALYRRNGYEVCGPFGGYTESDFSVFMVKRFR